jgi:Ca2+-binding EF-hand superfamily protein
METISNIYNGLLGLWQSASVGDDVLLGLGKLNDEEMEEYRMFSGFEEKEVLQIRRAFYKYTGRDEFLTREAFLQINWVEISPLKDRLCAAFGFDESPSISFKRFLEVVASFNSTGFGRREHKLRVAFLIQDMDGDGLITRPDILAYINRITAEGMSTEDVNAMADHILAEASSDPKGEKITYTDFQRVMAPTDFHTKLRLPI